MLRQPARYWLVLACGLGLPVASAAALDVPPTPDHYFTDYAHVVPADRASEVDRRLAAIESSSGHQVIAVLFPSLGDEPLEDFTIRCAEKWKVGRKGLDDGIIFFAFLKDRRMRLEVGYGLEDKVPDAIASRLLTGTVRPYFAESDYAGGVLALVGSLERIFRGEPPPPPRPRSRQRSGPPFGFIALIVMFMVFRALFGRRRGRGLGSGLFWGGFGGLGGFGGGGFGGGGFSGGGGSFGGGGASGSW